jgi:hypothetical protein
MGTVAFRGASLVSLAILAIERVMFFASWCMGRRHAGAGESAHATPVT